MATDYSEKRNFFRMNLECAANYTVNGSNSLKSGTVTDLSGDGISIIADQEVTLGTEVRVSIKPDNAVTPPLEVVMEVTRCEQKDTENYLLAGSITKQ